MKITIEGKPPIIIGKRITLGACISSFTAIFAHIFPEQAPAIIASAVPITFIAQIIVVHWFGVTT
jgi:hypothetical protein